MGGPEGKEKALLGEGKKGVYTGRKKPEKMQRGGIMQIGLRNLGRKKETLAAICFEGAKVVRLRKRKRKTKHGRKGKKR